MPFGYFGAKHGAARMYPAPRYDWVVEPFAGAAGYACYWARRNRISHAILIDNNPAVIALWRRLQAMSVRELMSLVQPPLGTKSADPLFTDGGRQGLSMLVGRPQSITSRMVKDWPRVRARIAATLPLIREWDIRCGDYTDAPDIEATWFIDPPYGLRDGVSGKKTAGGYSYKDARAITFTRYNELAAWCRARTGQVIVCEQMPADWLPFRAFRRQRNAVGRGRHAIRTEAIWLNEE